MIFLWRLIVIIRAISVFGDPQKDNDIVDNHLDLAESVTFADGRKLEFLYDGTGRLWSKILKDAGGNELQRHNYIGSFETINDKVYSVMHSEGRMVNEGLEDYLNYLYLVLSQD